MSLKILHFEIEPNIQIDLLRYRIGEYCRQLFAQYAERTTGKNPGFVVFAVTI
jgi:hypothetical protein